TSPLEAWAGAPARMLTTSPARMAGSMLEPVTRMRRFPEVRSDSAASSTLIAARPGSPALGIASIGLARLLRGDDLAASERHRLEHALQAEGGVHIHLLRAGCFRVQGPIPAGPRHWSSAWLACTAFPGLERVVK